MMTTNTDISKKSKQADSWNEDHVFSKLAVATSSALSSAFCIAAHASSSSLDHIGRSLALAYGSMGLACSLWFWVRVALHVRAQHSFSPLVSWVKWVLDVSATAFLYLGAAYLYFRAAFRTQPVSQENNVAGFHLGGVESATVCLVMLTLVLLSINVGIDLYRTRKSQEQLVNTAAKENHTTLLPSTSDRLADSKRRSSGSSSRHSNQERAPVFSSKKTYKKFDTVTGGALQPPPPTPPKMPAALALAAAAPPAAQKPTRRQSMVPVLLPEVTRQDLFAAKSQLRPVPEEKGRKRKLTMEPPTLHNHLQKKPEEKEEPTELVEDNGLEMLPVPADHPDGARMSTPTTVSPPPPPGVPTPAAKAADEAPPSRSVSAGSILNQNFVAFTSPSTDSNASRHSERFI